MDVTLTVSQLVEVINLTLGSLGAIKVEGEVSGYKIIHNKWVTFYLKDDISTVSCFMTVWQLRTQIEDGMMVKAVGVPKLREKGFFSFVVETLQPAGEGALKRAFELLKRKLEREGIFLPERKRPLPRFPQHVVLITSRDAAAYNDFLKVLSARFGGLRISFIHTQVQGQEAPGQIIDAINTANTFLKNPDVIVLVRGGGSLEDLHAFNDEAVVRAVASSRVPTIVGIGHERDICLAELAADLRASTPSNAAELLIPSRQEVQAEILNSLSRLTHAARSQVEQCRQKSSQAALALSAQYANSLHAAGRLLENTVRILNSLSPENILKRGFSITTDENGAVLRDASRLKVGHSTRTRLAKGSFTADVTKVLVKE